MLDDEPPPWSITLWYAVEFAFFGLLCLILNAIWDKYIFLGFDDLRAHGTSMSEGLSRVWFIFAWAGVATLLIGIYYRNQPREAEPVPAFIKGMWVSLNAGIFEELIFRWLIFLNAMVGVVFLNTITFGLVEWLYREALIPLANFTTLGHLETQLMSANWVLGAAIVSASITFRDQHEYLGWFGWINSWFIGMVMFWLVFNYGIGTAIVAHVVYDAIILAVVALSYSWRPRYTSSFGRLMGGRY